MKSWPARAADLISTIENWLIAILALALVLLSGVQIVLRLLDHGLVWLDPLLRVLVIWVALLGAVAAARVDKHISLEIASKLLHGRTRRFARVIAYSFAALVCVLMLRASLGLIEVDRESGTMLHEQVPTWWAELILPLAFGLLAFRFAVRAFSAPIAESQ